MIDLATYYAKQRAKADKKIRAKGQLGRIQRFDATGVAKGEFEAAFIVTSYDEKAVDGALILPDDRKAMVSALADDGVTPIPQPTGEDRLLDVNGVVFDIVVCNPLAPAGIAVFYELQLRR